jgi:hypothetical protein
MTQKAFLSRGRVAVGVLFLLVAVGGAHAGDDLTGGFTPVPTLISNALERNVPFIFNTLKTTRFGPAWADIQVEPTNFLPCRGGPFALCYYSGPEPESCELSTDGRIANCKCSEIPYGAYFVDINAILNMVVYLETIRVCGHDGRKCQNANDAPVCRHVNRNTLIPGAELISAFSFDCAPEEGIGQTTCPKALYAGCMTAPCRRTGEAGTVECSCPTFNGPYQVGENNAQCQLGSNLVWSAAYNPKPPGRTPGGGGKTFPTPSSCIPDAPGSVGCPLVSAEVPPPPSNAKCEEVCQQYRRCRSEGVESGFTCDATLCTATCADRGLVNQACSGLQQCDVSAIAELEKEVGCSCCASQICGCAPNDATSEALLVLNQLQRDRGIVPQCDVNGTLCGSAPR